MNKATSTCIFHDAIGGLGECARLLLGRDMRQTGTLASFGLLSGANSRASQSSRRRSVTVQAVLCIFGAALTVVSTFAQQARSISLRQAIEIAVRQNPDVLIARLEQEKAQESVREARAPFLPQVAVGSGLAYTDGIPQSVEGAAPSIVRAVGRQFLFNRAQSNLVKQAREMEAAAAHMTAGERDEVAFRVASTYLDYERAWRRARLLDEQVDSRNRIEGVIAARVEEGRAIPLDLSRARLETSRTRRLLQSERAQAEVLEATLKHELDLDRSVRLEPAPTDFVNSLALPSEASARQEAIAHSPELKRISATLRAKNFEARAEKATLFPRVDLVAQYSLLGRFNNFEDFFNKFQRHNGQIGMSFQIPVFGRKEVSARVGKVRREARELEIRRAATQSSLELETQRLYRDLREAESQEHLARQELDFARESLTVILAQFDEGRTALEDIERARLLESQAWTAYYDAQYSVQKAKLNLLRQTGELVAAVQ